VSLTQGSPGAHAAQGGVTLGLEQGEPGANFCHLGKAEVASTSPEERTVYLDPCNLFEESEEATSSLFRPTAKKQASQAKCASSSSFSNVKDVNFMAC
jgi:hypothetical protein